MRVGANGRTGELRAAVTEWATSAYSPQKGSQDLRRIRANNPHDRDEFHDVNVVLQALELSHERLRRAQALCDVILAEASLLAGCDCVRVDRRATLT
jgi:hypothetical protein